MKKLIKNLIHLWDLKLYEKQINKQAEDLVEENNFLKETIYNLSPLNNDDEARKNSIVRADIISNQVQKQKDFHAHWMVARRKI